MKLNRFPKATSLACSKIDPQQIAADKGLNYLNIIASGELEKYVKNVRMVPTTLFVDSEGKFVHDPFVGADVEGYKSVVDSLTD